MHQASWENKDFSLFDGLRNENVGSGDEADVELAFEDEDDLGGAGVSVGRIDSAGGVVNAGKGDAESVETGDFLDVGAGDKGTEGVVG